MEPQMMDPMEVVVFDGSEAEVASLPVVDVPIEFYDAPIRVEPAAIARVRRFPTAHVNTLHLDVVDRIHADRLNKPQDSDKLEYRNAILASITHNNMPYSGVERDQLADQVLQEIYGYGPLQPLLDDETIDDILVNSHELVYVERNGLLEETTVRFHSVAHLMNVISRIVSAVGRRVDESSPMVDARLPNGSRVNIIIPPLALNGPCVSIRKFGTKPLDANNLIENKSITPQMLDFLNAAVRAKLTVIVSGGTGAGKTTLLNVISRSIGSRERIVTIEDSAELILQQKHVVRLECRPPNTEGTGEVRPGALLINALRMRPDRIIMGEVRGPETFDLLQAMNTGHDGSIATIHANTPRDAIARLESMVMMVDGLNLPEKSIRQQIANAVHLVVQVTRLSDGRRRVTNISEITGMQGDVLTMQDIFSFEKSGLDAEGHVHGTFSGFGRRPKCLETITRAGISLGNDVFNHSMEV
jgi:pilus assembly protein CpaF